MNKRHRRDFGVTVSYGLSTKREFRGRKTVKVQTQSDSRAHDGTAEIQLENRNLLLALYDKTVHDGTAEI